MPDGSIPFPGGSDYSLWKWEDFVNIYSGGATPDSNDGTGDGVAFPQTVNRSSVVAGAWTKGDPQYADQPVGGNRIEFPVPISYTETNKHGTSDPATHYKYASVSWADEYLDDHTAGPFHYFYTNSLDMLRAISTPRGTSTTQLNTLSQLRDLFTKVADQLNTYQPVLDRWLNQIGKTDSDFQGTSADVVWQIFKNIKADLTQVIDRIHTGAGYLDKAYQMLDRYQQATIEAWNDWVVNDTPADWTVKPGLTISTAPSQLVNPVSVIGQIVQSPAFLGSLVPGVVNKDDRHHGSITESSKGSSPYFAGTVDSAAFWQDLESAAKNVWGQVVEKHLDSQNVHNVLQALASIYAVSQQDLRPITKPDQGPIEIKGITSLRDFMGPFCWHIFLLPLNKMRLTNNFS